jgi:superfamily I DNA and/or RNA helicase
LEEVKSVVKVVEDLLNLWLNKSQIWIISPYAAQVSKLKNVLSEIEINTVDGFQWREKEVIIISWVRNENMGFLVDYRRLNVAITRAKRLLVNIWNSANLMQDKIFKKYVSYVKNVGVFK